MLGSLFIVVRSRRSGRYSCANNDRCSVRRLDSTKKAAIRVWKGVVEYTPSTLVRSSGSIEEVADQTGLELFRMHRQLSALSHVASSFT